MPVLLPSSDPSSGALVLRLSHEGVAADAFSVTWTVFSSSGEAVSGTWLPAVRSGTGRYYAPWSASAKTGNHRIVWRVQTDPGAPLTDFEQKFFVADPSSYQCSGGVCPDGTPEPGGLAYLSGTALGRGDLPIFFKDSAGVPSDPYAVYWTILDSSGFEVTQRAAASKAATGEYFAGWTVSAPSGEYVVRWEWYAAAGDPATAELLPFSVVVPSALAFTGQGGCFSVGLPLCSPASPACCLACSQ